MTTFFVSTPGDQGPPGNSVWPTNGAPSSSLGVDGDFANDVDNSVMYGPKANGSWPTGISYRGQPGATGNTIWPTSGVPSPELGINGDFANDVADSIMYGPKAGGAWPAGTSYKGPQGIPGAAAKWVPGTPYKGLVATRGASPSQVVTAKFFMSRYPMIALQDIHTIGCTLPQFTANGGDFPIGSSRTTKCRFEYNGAVVAQPTFGGQVTGTVQDFSFLESDEVPCTTMIPKGSLFYMREYSTTTGTQLPTASFGVTLGANTANGTCFQYGNTGINDLTDVPGSFPSTESFAFAAPAAVWSSGVVVAAVGITGDSRNHGWSDAYATLMDIGETARSVGKKRAYTNMSRGLETAGAVAVNGMPLRAAIINKYCTHVYCNYEVNDLFNTGSTPQQVIGWVKAIRDMFPGKYFYFTTAMGETTSSNGYIDVAGQTLVSQADEISRQQAVAFFKTFGGFDAVYDVASVVENAPNTGIWKPGMTDDGIHENPNGYQAVADSGVVLVP